MNTKIRKSFTLQEKIEIINEAKVSNLSHLGLSKKLNIPRTTIMYKNFKR